jgi:hypothetical protein
VLLRRYEAERRAHPLAGRDRVVDGIQRERELLADLRAEADLVIEIVGRLLAHLSPSSPLTSSAASPATRGGETVGVVSAGIDVGIFSEVLQAERHDPHVVVWVVDSNGVLLARRPHAPELIGADVHDRAVVRAALAAPRGAAELPDLFGAPRLFAFQAISQTGAVVAASIFTASVFIGLFGSELFIFRPLRSLAETASAIRRGQLGARSSLKGLSEVGALRQEWADHVRRVQRGNVQLVQQMVADGVRDRSITPMDPILAGIGVLGIVEAWQQHQAASVDGTR